MLAPTYQELQVERSDTVETSLTWATQASSSARTGSIVARRILEGWSPRRFVKVLPHDYARALRDFPISSGGAGFLTRETEEAAH